MLCYERHKDRLTVRLEGELDHARVGPILSLIHICAERNTGRALWQDAPREGWR